MDHQGSPSNIFDPRLVKSYGYREPNYSFKRWWEQKPDPNEWEMKKGRKLVWATLPWEEGREVRI